MPSAFRNAGSSHQDADSARRTRIHNHGTHAFGRSPRRMQTGASVAQERRVMGVCGDGETIYSSCRHRQHSEMNTHPDERPHPALSSSTPSGQSLSDRSNGSTRASKSSDIDPRSHRTMEHVARTASRRRVKTQVKQARQNGAKPFVEVDISIQIGRAETEAGSSHSATATSTDITSSTSTTDLSSSPTSTTTPQGSSTDSSTSTSELPTSTAESSTSTTQSSTSTTQSSTSTTESSTSASSSSSTESSSAPSSSSTISSTSVTRSESSQSSPAPSSTPGSSSSSSSTSISSSTASSSLSSSSSSSASSSSPSTSSTNVTTPTATSTSTFVSFTTFFTTIPPTDAPISITSTTTSTSSGTLNTNNPDSNSRFAQNKGAIIGVSIGGVVAVILAVVILFFLCGRWRRRATPPPDGNVGGAGSLKRNRTIGSSTRRMLMRNHSSGNASTWRPPLSDEDVEDDAPRTTLGQTPSTLMAVGGGFGSHDHSSSGSLGMRASPSNSGHGHPEEIIPAPPLPVARRPSFTQHPPMPGFGQAAEHMSGVSPTSPNSASALVSSSPAFPSKSTSPTSPPSAYLIYTPSPSRTSHDYGSSSHGHDGVGSSSLHHTNTMMSAASSSSGSHSHSTPHSHGHYIPNRVRVREDPPPIRKESTSSFRGLVSRLRGGARTSSDGTTSSGNRSTPRDGSSNPSALSFHYPPSAGPSSLLNPPPVPVVRVHEEPVGIPMPPSPTEDSSSIRVTEGLLDTHLVGREGGPLGMSANAGVSQVSLGSLRDNVDYSRPYRGFVFNRMGSSATFATQTTVGGRTPGPADSPRLTSGRINEEADYFGRGIAM